MHASQKISHLPEMDGPVRAGHLLSFCSLSLPQIRVARPPL